LHLDVIGRKKLGAGKDVERKGCQEEIREVETLGQPEQVGGWERKTTTRGAGGKKKMLTPNIKKVKTAGASSIRNAKKKAKNINYRWT